MARDAISLMLEVPAGSFDVEVVVTPPESIRELLAEYRSEREVADSSTRRAAELAHWVLEKSDGEHLMVRDLGQLMGLSFQRVQQMRSARPSAAATLEKNPSARRRGERRSART